MKLAELAVNGTGTTQEFRYLAKALAAQQDQCNQIVLQLQKHQLLIELLGNSLKTNRILFETMAAMQNATTSEDREIVENNAEKQIEDLMKEQAETVKKVKELQ